MNKRIFSILPVLLLLVTCALPVSAAKKEPEKEPITIATVEEFLAFAESCRLDTYSVGLTVSLAADLDLSEETFFGVPIFCGTFEGNDHTISGLHLTAEGSAQGLFRYLTATAVVQDLNVAGEVLPRGSRSTVGGIAGSNAGQILRCSFRGNVSGSDSIGGLVGVNGVSGVMEDCDVQGSVSGNHFVGGVAGSNYGVIRGCVNEARVNTTSQENSVNLTDVTVESLTNTEYTGTTTDLGGIAGTSSGVIRGCKNNAGIGYRHMGYNVGGIAGTQSGYVADCENSGSVYGRKEVGGIVGHMEPFSVIEYSRDGLQMLEGQLKTLSGLTNQASSNAQANAGTITTQLGELQNQTETARDAVGVLLDVGNDADTIIAAQNALSSSLTGMKGSVSEIGEAASNTAVDLSRDMRAITNQVNSMSQTLSQVSSAVGGSFEDVSDSDTAKDQGGKVESCVNRGDVFGDANIGGITGAMALENDLDPEDDWTVSGSSSLNVSGEIRAVVLGCENYGDVTGKKRNIGGISGWQYMGLVKESNNFGAVDASAADYVGGISGQSNGFIRMSSAKCTLYGQTYVGGISGCAGIVSDCCSMVEIHGAKERVGAVLGYIQEGDSDEEEPIRDNFYLILSQDLGAIDGISYSGQAEPQEREVFVEQEDLDESFRNVTLRFFYETGDPVEIIVPLGGSVSEEEIPVIPEKEGYVCEWEGLSDADLSNVLFDLEFHALYISRDSVIASEEVRENGMPVVLVQGVFTSDAAVHVSELEDGPTVGFGRVLQEAWKIELTEGENVTAVRFRLPEGSDSEHVCMYVCGGDGVWREAEHTVDGSYAVVAFTADDLAIAYARTPILTYVLLVAALGAVLFIWQYKGLIPRKHKK